MRIQSHALVAVALLSITACRSSGSSSAEQTLVLEARGEVTQGGRQLVAGAAVDLNQTIEVGNGRCILQLPDGEELRLYAGSQLRPASPSHVRLLLGKLWARVTPGRATRLEVETPNAVAGVRGTEFFVEVAAKRTRVAVIRGRVAVANRRAPKKETTVEAGRQVIVEADEPPKPAEAFDPAPEKDSWKALEAVPATTPPTDEAPEGEVVPEERGTAPTDAVPARRKSAMEKEGDETKRQLKKEAAKTEEQLKKEEAGTRKALADEEKRTRESLEKDRDKAKGSVKDFLD